MPLPNAEQIKVMYQKITENEQEDKRFSENLHKLLNGDKTLASRPLVIGKTPNALVICGADERLDVQIGKKVIDKCLRPEVRDENGKLVGKTGHGLTEQQLVEALNNIKNPAMILQGSRDDTLVAVVGLQDNQDREMLVAISLNKIGAVGEVNEIASVYGRDNFESFIEKQFEQGKVLAVNKDKADEMPLSIGKWYPKANTFISFDNSIAYSIENVKYPEKEAVKSNMTDKIFELNDAMLEAQGTENDSYVSLYAAMYDEGLKELLERTTLLDQTENFNNFEEIIEGDAYLNVYLNAYGNGTVTMNMVLDEVDNIYETSVPLTEEEQQKLFKLADHAMEKEGGVKSMIKNALAEEDKEAKVEVSEEPAKSAEITKTYLTDLPKVQQTVKEATRNGKGKDITDD